MTEPDPELGVESEAPQPAPYELNQRRRMIIALSLMLVALALVLIKDWSFWSDFWFPPDQTAELDEAAPTSPAEGTSQPQAATAKSKSVSAGKKSKKHEAATEASAAPADITPIVTNRAALPPLEIEVVAGDEHRTVRPGSNSVKLDLRPRSPVQSSGAAVDQTAAIPERNFTMEAGDRMRLSPQASQALSRPVTPDYPLLARQMKVQGSVSLQALISKEGVIQDLQVLNGPAILAAAAREAVKQWRFKPYYQGGAAVETQARITVNFTISTN